MLCGNHIYFVGYDQMKRLLISIVLLSLIIIGCSNKPTKIPESRNLKGTITSEGHLIFFEWTTYEGGKFHHHAALRDNYGMMIFYDAYVDNPIPRFELYSYDDKSIYNTVSLEEFKEALSLIPSGKKLYYYNTCAGGTHHGLDPNLLNGIKTFCKDNNIIFQNGDDKLFFICTCP